MAYHCRPMNNENLKLTPQDFKESDEVAELVVKMDNLSVDYVNSTGDDIFQQQPFFLTVLLGYRPDFTPEEHGEFIKIYFLIWEFFKANKNVQTKKVTEADFEKIEARHLAMFKYVEGEFDPQEISKVYLYDLENLKSKSLFSAVLFRYNTRPVIMNMDDRDKTLILVGIKSFIECFEKC